MPTLPDQLDQLAATMRDRAACYHEPAVQRSWLALAEAMEQASADLRASASQIAVLTARLEQTPAAHNAADAAGMLAALVEMVELVRATTREPNTYDKLTTALRQAGIRPRMVATHAR